MPQNPLISFEYVVQNEQSDQQQQFVNPSGIPIMTHPTANGNVKATNNRAGYQVFRPSAQAQAQENIEIWHHGPR